MNDTGHDNNLLLQRARHAISEKWMAEPSQLSNAEPALSSKGVFVTLTKGGELRGCIGHLSPIHKNLLHEIDECAKAAAFSDRRFEPLQKDELADIKIEISLLEPPELVSDLADLDPRTFGVIVRSGHLQGTLLPDIKGVDDARQQISIAARKAGISPNEPIEIYRYRVTKIAEDKQ